MVETLTDPCFPAITVGIREMQTQVQWCRMGHHLVNCTVFLTCTQVHRFQPMTVLQVRGGRADYTARRY